MNDAMDRQTHVDDLLAERFIRNTDCLDTVGDAGNLERGLDCASTARPSSRPVKSQPVSGRIRLQPQRSCSTSQHVETYGRTAPAHGESRVDV